MPTWQSFVIYLFIPYLLGVGITHWFPEQANASTQLLSRWLSLPVAVDEPQSPTEEESWHAACYQQLTESMGVVDTTTSIALHHNGQAEPCCVISADDLFRETAVMRALTALDNCPDWNSQYVVDSFVTRLVREALGEACSDEQQGFYAFCDRGLSHTPVLYDHHQLIPNIADDGSPYLPCHFHNASGYRLSSLSLLREWVASVPPCADDETSCGSDSTAPPLLEMYAVPAGRHFMFAPKYAGEIIPLPHVTGGDPTQPVYLKVLSVSPRVFDIVNFFSKQESDDLVEQALQETRESHRIKRSTTGSDGYKVNRFRTSESGFVSSGETAINIKRRSFSVLGMNTYIESYSDGLQILRYPNGTAYNKHMDWIEPAVRFEHDYNSAGKGSNRFATLLLYMSDLEPNQGGETVFTKAWPSDVAEADRITVAEAKEQILDSELSSFFVPGSWEEELTAWCRSRLAVRPNSARAVLFYSQLPDGQEDKSSLHAACPVFNTTKYAANLWVWNAARAGYPDSPKNPKYKKPQIKPVAVTFINTGTDPAMENAELFFKDTSWGRLRPDGTPITATTYKGHEWRVVVDGKEVKRWKISALPETQEFKI